MKNIIVALLFISTLNVVAQKKGEEKNLTPAQKAERVVGEISERTYLSTDRKDSLTEIYVSYYQNLQTYKANANEKLAKAIEQTKETKVKNLLNAEQYQAYKDFMAEEQAKKAKQEEKKQTPGMNSPNNGNRSANRW